MHSCAFHTKFIPDIHWASQHPSFNNFLAKKIVRLLGKFVTQFSKRTGDFIPSGSGSEWCAVPMLIIGCANQDLPHSNLDFIQRIVTITTHQGPPMHKCTTTLSFSQVKFLVPFGLI